MLQTIPIDQVKEALDQFNKVCLIKTKFLIFIYFVFFFKGQKYLYNTLTTTIKENQANVKLKNFYIKNKLFNFLGCLVNSFIR